MTQTNVYAKLQKARVLLSKTELKKSGNNTHLKFGYFELQDFIPAINEIFEDIGLIGVMDFSIDNRVYLNIHNTENPDDVVTFCIDKADAGLRTGTPIQNTGAQQTYLRRYLWIQAMELTENDAVDTLGSDEKITQADRERQKAVSKDKQEAISHKESLTNALTVEALRTAYKAIPGKFKTGDLEAYAKKRADELTPVSVKIDSCTTMEELTAVCDKLTEEQEKDYDSFIQAKLDEFKL